MIVAGGVLARAGGVRLLLRADHARSSTSSSRRTSRSRRWSASSRGRCSRAVMTRDLRRYLAVSRGETASDAPPAAAIYRRAQALPYRLALLTIAVWFVIAIVGALDRAPPPRLRSRRHDRPVDRDARARGRRRDLRAAVASRRAAPAARAPDAALSRAGAQHRAVAVAAQQADAVVRRRRAARVRHGAAVGLRPVQEPRRRRGRSAVATSACAGCTPSCRPSSAARRRRRRRRSGARRARAGSQRRSPRRPRHLLRRRTHGDARRRRRRPDGRAEAALVHARA